jgi:hypothetical protein
MPISDRAAAGAALLLLAACSDPRTGGNAVAQAAAEDNGDILCARGGAAIARDCTVDRTPGPRGLILTLRHPDGGFRRLLITRDGRGVVAADGAEPATVRIVEQGTIDVAVGGDRYRLPATVGAAR